MSVCIYIYVCIHIHTHTHSYTYVCIYMPTHAHIHIQAQHINYSSTLHLYGWGKKSHNYWLWEEPSLGRALQSSLLYTSLCPKLTPTSKRHETESSLGSRQSCHIGLSQRHVRRMSPDGLENRRWTQNLLFGILALQTPSSWLLSTISRDVYRKETCLTLQSSSPQGWSSCLPYQRAGGLQGSKGLPSETSQKVHRPGWSPEWKGEGANISQVLSSWASQDFTILHSP